MKTADIHIVYLIGIGGIGMSALARYFKAEGKIVCGYDKTPTPLTSQLVEEGIDIHFEDQKENIPFFQKLENGELQKEEVLLIYTPAIPVQHEELNYLKAKGFIPHKRSEILGLLTQEKFTIAIAGTHGKTTTSSMVTQMLTYSKTPCIGFLGGISKNFMNNMILPLRSEIQNALVVVEADEYDRSFLSLHPDIAIITSMDADHLDIYGTEGHMAESYNQFASLLKTSGKLIVKSGLPIQAPHMTYSIYEPADYEGMHIRIENHRYVFDVKTPYGIIKDLRIGLPGRHNVENAVAALAVGIELHISESDIRKSFELYSGVKRRFEKIIENTDITYIDDYAHHPEEIRALLSSVNEMYPGKKIMGIFQPHLYSRTRDFAGAFAESLSLLNELILLDIYPARELPIEGVTSQIIAQQIKSHCHASITTKEEALEMVKKMKPEVLLTIGAGDIDTLVEPLKHLFEKK